MPWLSFWRKVTVVFLKFRTKAVFFVYFFGKMGSFRKKKGKKSAKIQRAEQEEFNVRTTI
jgi:hypothetical protein